MSSAKKEGYRTRSKDLQDLRERIVEAEERIEKLESSVTEVLEQINNNVDLQNSNQDRFEQEIQRIIKTRKTTCGSVLSSICKLLLIFVCLVFLAFFARLFVLRLDDTFESS